MVYTSSVKATKNPPAMKFSAAFQSSGILGMVCANGTFCTMGCFVPMELFVPWAALCQWNLLHHGMLCVNGTFCTMGCFVPIKLLYHGMLCTYGTFCTIGCFVPKEPFVPWYGLCQWNKCRRDQLDCLLWFMFYADLCRVLFHDEFFFTLHTCFRHVMCLTYTAFP